MVILGLGSNSGDREAYLRQAIVLLGGLLQAMRVSGVYESKALLLADAPREWDKPFLNMAVVGETTLSLQELLKAIKAIEQKLGRKSLGKWSPREIDIDILAMGDQVVDTPVLQVPHHELLNRDFALLPLAELAPDWIYPLAGKYNGWKALDIAVDKGFDVRRQQLKFAAHG